MIPEPSAPAREKAFKGRGRPVDIRGERWYDTFMQGGKPGPVISAEDYRTIVSELMDELPEEFFRGLNGGVVVSDRTVIPEYARNEDLYIMGQYRVSAGIRQIVLFRGSFDRAYPGADRAQARSVLRRILRHEFRHHLESRGGVRGASSLEAEDERKKQAYLAGHGR